MCTVHFSRREEAVSNLCSTVGNVNKFRTKAKCVGVCQRRKGLNLKWLLVVMIEVLIQTKTNSIVLKTLNTIKDFKNWGYLYLSLYERLQYIYIYERPRGPGDHNNVTTRRTRFSCRSLFVRNMKQVFIFRDIGNILVITKYCL